MNRALQFGKLFVCIAAVVAMSCVAFAEWQRAKLEISLKGEAHASAAQAKSDEHLLAMDAHQLAMISGIRAAQTAPIIENARKATASLATAAEKWNKASDAQIENANKTGADARRVIAHFDRLLTNEVQPTLANVKSASAELPAAITSIQGTAEAATEALNATKKPMDALDVMLRDQENGIPKLIREGNGTMEETHATAGNFEVWSEKLTHPASAIKQWFYGLLDIAWKGKTLAK